MTTKITGIVLLVLSALIMMGTVNQVPAVMQLAGDSAYDGGYIAGRIIGIVVFIALAVFLFIKGRKMVRQSQP